MKILTYNINGLRSAISKGLVKWLEATGADVICLQEIKSTPEQVDTTEFEAIGFKYLYWHPAVKKRIQWCCYIFKN